MRDVTCGNCGEDTETTDVPDGFTGSERWQCPKCQHINVEPAIVPDNDIVVGDNGSSEERPA